MRQAPKFAHDESDSPTGIRFDIGTNQSDSSGLHPSSETR